MSTLLARSGKPYLSQLVPLVALVREQRFAPAQAGDAFFPYPFGANTPEELRAESATPNLSAVVKKRGF